MNKSGDAYLNDAVDSIHAEVRETIQAAQMAFDTVLDCCDAVSAAFPDDKRIQEAVARIYESGAVQDVIRQRLEKIGRIAARIADPSLPADDPLLAGPQNEGGGLQQDEINRLLGESD